MSIVSVEWRQVGTLAMKEFRDRIRNRWVLAVAAVFTVFSLAIAWFGGAQQGAVGLQSAEATIASLVSLVIYLIPLIALLLGFDAVVGERERGSLDLLLALPITRGELLLGKYLGLAAALTLSTLAGFAAVAVLMAGQLGANGLYHYLGFMLSSVLLGLAFLSLAVLMSVLARDRTRASGLAIALWFGFVLVFDLLLLGALVASGGRVGGDVFAYLLLLNPADVFRILNVFSLDDLRTLYGLASIVPPALASPWLMGGAMLGWIVAPLLAAGWRFR
jgi:Cu-processing system permease protein